MIDIEIHKLSEDSYAVGIDIRDTCCVKATMSATGVIELRHTLHNELLYLDRVIRREGIADDS